MVKTSSTVHPGYASYVRGTETAKVEGLWPGKDPNACPKHPDNSNSSSQTPRAWLHSPIYSSPPFMQERSS